MLLEILNDELPREWRFEQAIAGGLPMDTQQRLRSFWAMPELSGLGTEAHLPHRDWREIGQCLLQLVDRQPDPSVMPLEQAEERARVNELWWRATEMTETLAADDPIAGSIAALCCLARWEGVLGPSLFKEFRTPAHWGLSDGWRHFPLIAARNLARADAIWTAWRLARVARDTIEGSERYIVSRSEGLGFRHGFGGRALPGGEDWWHAAAEYDAILLDLSRRQTACVEDLAWDLWDSCSLEAPNFRAEVAALFWALGDVPHGQLLRDTDATPSREAVAGLVRRSLVVIPTDTCVQWIWLMLRDRPPFSLRDHPEIFASISHRWPVPGDCVFEPVPTDVEPVGQAFAEAAVAYFRHEFGYDAVSRLGHAYRLSKPEFAPEAVVRLGSLLTMAGSHPVGAAEDEAWSALAERSCEIVEARDKSHLRDPYDRTLDIPFYYLQPSSSAALRRASELIERYRAAGMWFWRRVIAPVTDCANPEARKLAAEERELADQLRGARFAGLLPRLPSGYHRLTWSLIPVPREQQAESDMVELAGQIENVAERIVELCPEQAADRLTTQVGIEAFAAALTPSHPRG